MFDLELCKLVEIESGIFDSLETQTISVETNKKKASEQYVYLMTLLKKNLEV